MKTLTVPENLMQKFRNQENGETETFDSGVDFINQIVDNLDGYIEKGMKGFDKSAKNRGLPGLGAVDPETYSEVTAIVAKKWIPKKWLSHTPEGLFLSATLGILYINVQAYRKQQNEDSDNG